MYTIELLIYDYGSMFNRIGLVCIKKLKYNSFVEFLKAIKNGEPETFFYEEISYKRSGKTMDLPSSLKHELKNIKFLNK